MIKEITIIANSVNTTSAASGDDLQLTIKNIDKVSLKENVKDCLFDLFDIEELEKMISEEKQEIINCLQAAIDEKES